MVIHTCARVCIHKHPCTHTCTHTSVGQKSVPRQKRKLVEEWLSAGCQQLWTSGQPLPLCPSLQHPPDSPWKLLVNTLGQDFLDRQVRRTAS